MLEGKNGKVQLSRDCIICSIWIHSMTATMKSWLHNHRLRKQRSESHLLPIKQDEPFEVMKTTPKRPPPLRLDDAAKLAVSSTSSRMSIERYLQAPLEDEPASVPAITAALKRQNSQKSQTAPVLHHTTHSRESSYDAASDGRRTFYTSGSAPTSTGTSYSFASKTNRAGAHQRNISLPDVPEVPKAEQLEFEAAKVSSPERPTTSGTVDMEKTWAEQMEKLMPGYQRDTQIDYRARAEVEIARIQDKARELEEEMRKFKQEREASPELLVPRVTDEMAYAQMAARPKLAWILGGDIADAKSIERPKSSGSALTSTTDAAERPDFGGLLKEEAPQKELRRSRSSGALDEKARQAAVNKRAAGFFERKPSKRPKFFCTFCQKRFHSRLEWMRHEETIHMPEELWVCCPRTGQFPDRCPFCAKTNPSPAHLADHNYLTCQNKPLSERTFDRKDHFLQHIAQEHKVSPGQKPLRLTELLEAWKHPLSLREGHQALHCGFCGKTFPSYKGRREHVAQHFLEGQDMMSWWSARVNHDVPHPKPSESMHRNPNVPYSCSYCERTYADLATAQKLHPVCSMWSCSFLPGMQYTIYPAGSKEELEAVCCYCNDTLVRGSGRVKGSVLRDHINQHNFRNCNQRLYFSGQRFRQHLQDNHKSSYDGTLFAGWPLLLKSSKKEKPSIFEPVDPATMALRRAYTDPTSVSIKASNRNPKISTDLPPEMPKLNFMDLSETPLRPTAPRKRLRRKASNQSLPAPSSGAREIRSSKHFFTRAATIDLAYGTNASSSPSHTTNPSPGTSSQHTHHRPGFPLHSLPIDAVTFRPVFYRRRLDASTRNRIYVRDEAVDGPLSKNSQRLFRRVEKGAFGGLVLHSSMVGASVARMTNSVDVYCLH